MRLQPVELDPEDSPMRCTHCGQQTRCAGQTIGSTGPTYTYCLACLCAFCEELPPLS